MALVEKNSVPHVRIDD